MADESAPQEPLSDPPEGVVVRRDAPLSRVTAMRLGGTCDAYIVVHDRDALPATDAWCREQGWNRTLLGASSRVVVRDGGLAGAVVRLGTGFHHVVEDDTGWWVGAAVPVAVIAARAGGGLGARTDAGGSIGASLALDDGWAPYVARVRYLHRGKEREGDLADIKARTKVWFTEVRLRKGVDAPAPGQVLPGAWFEPTDDDDPAELLAEAALAATRLRSVCVPDAAPDRLVNLGGATGKDVNLLLKSLIERVHQARGVKLQDRMMWWGRVS